MRLLCWFLSVAWTEQMQLSSVFLFTSDIALLSLSPSLLGANSLRVSLADSLLLYQLWRCFGVMDHSCTHLQHPPPPSALIIVTEWSCWAPWSDLGQKGDLRCLILSSRIVFLRMSAVLVQLSIVIPEVFISSAAISCKMHQPDGKHFLSLQRIKTKVVCVSGWHMLSSYQLLSCCLSCVKEHLFMSHYFLSFVASGKCLSLPTSHYRNLISVILWCSFRLTFFCFLTQHLIFIPIVLRITTSVHSYTDYMVWPHRPLRDWRRLWWKYFEFSRVD